MNTFIIKSSKKWLSTILAFLISFTMFTFEAEAGWEWAQWGTQVHIAVTKTFKMENQNRGNVEKSGKKIPGTGLFGTDIKGSFPDFVVDLNDSSISEIYELKPSSYRTGSKLESAQQQLRRYLDEYDNPMAYEDRIPIHGTYWQPLCRVVPVASVPNSPVLSVNKAVLLTTEYFTYPGLVFYDFVEPKEAPSEEYQIEPYAIRDAAGQEYTVFAREPQKGYVLAFGIFAGATVVVVGYIAANIFIPGLGAATTPAAYAAATTLIQKGLAAMPAQMMDQWVDQFITTAEDNSQFSIPEDSSQGTNLVEKQGGQQEKAYQNYIKIVENLLYFRKTDFIFG